MRTKLVKKKQNRLCHKYDKYDNLGEVFFSMISVAIIILLTTLFNLDAG